MVPPERIKGLLKTNEVTGNQPGALVDQLVERVLPIGSRLAPVNRSGVVGDPLPFQGDVFPVAFPGELLQVGGKALQVMLIGQYWHGLRAKGVVVPDAKEPQEDRQIAFEGSGPEMLVHLVEAVEHGAK